MTLYSFDVLLSRFGTNLLFHTGQEDQLEPKMEKWAGSKFGKEYVKATSLFSLYAEYIMQNGGLGGEQAGIKIAGRNINNLRYADGIILMAENKKRTKEPLDESERGEWKCWLKTQHSKI